MDDIPYAHGASYEVENTCLTGTRIEVIQSIIDWVNDPNGTAILALLGFAGSGKSAIAASISQYFDENDALGSSVFFDRDHQASRGPKKSVQYSRSRYGAIGSGGDAVVVGYRQPQS